MKYGKGTLFILKDSKQNYKVVGKWHDAWVLASEDPRDTDMIMYTTSEIEEGLGAGWIAVI